MHPSFPLGELNSAVALRTECKRKPFAQLHVSGNTAIMYLDSFSIKKGYITKNNKEYDPISCSPTFIH